MSSEKGGGGGEGPRVLPSLNAAPQQALTRKPRHGRRGRRRKPHEPLRPLPQHAYVEPPTVLAAGFIEAQALKLGEEGGEGRGREQPQQGMGGTEHCCGRRERGGVRAPGLQATTHHERADHAVGHEGLQQRVGLVQGLHVVQRNLGKSPKLHGFGPGARYWGAGGGGGGPGVLLHITLEPTPEECYAPHQQPPRRRVLGNRSRGRCPPPPGSPPGRGVARRRPWPSCRLRVERGSEGKSLAHTTHAHTRACTRGQPRT